MENDKLFELREYNNLTQKNVGEIIGVRQQTYAEWEKGKKIIPLKHLVTLAKYYNVSLLDYLIKKIYFINMLLLIKRKLVKKLYMLDLFII